MILTARPAVENPPFEVAETGWGGFAIDIRLHFQPLVHDKAQWRQHFLQLEPYGSEEQQAQQRAANLVRSEIQEVVEFNEPPEALFEALTDETQWDYLNAPAAAAQWMHGPGPGNMPPAPPEVTGTAGSGGAGGGGGAAAKGKKAPLAGKIVGGVAVDKNGRPRTHELPALSTPTNPYSREMEEAELKQIATGETELAKELEALEARKKALETELEELKTSGDFVVQKKK
jgi:transcription initiation factor IIF auxiliary subunit